MSFTKLKIRYVACVYMVYRQDIWLYITFDSYIFVLLSFPEVHQEKLHEIFLEVLLIGSVFSILLSY